MAPDAPRRSSVNRVLIGIGVLLIGSYTAHRLRELSGDLPNYIILNNRGRERPSAGASDPAGDEADTAPRGGTAAPPARVHHYRTFTATRLTPTGYSFTSWSISVGVREWIE